MGAGQFFGGISFQKKSYCSRNNFKLFQLIKTKIMLDNNIIAIIISCYKEEERLKNLFYLFKLRFKKNII
jgi:hypothetical protein